MPGNFPNQENLFLETVSVTCQRLLSPLLYQKMASGPFSLLGRGEAQQETSAQIFKTVDCSCGKLVEPVSRFPFESDSEQPALEGVRHLPDRDRVLEPLHMLNWIILAGVERHDRIPEALWDRG
ncbi:hypothetical protein KSP39_PZI001901 [Platanthera zijinensis]|uniref:Uncharacterized protein n=1 Tax=Platanthera zijinensis TaxID=2320716 RepID=A0AAP0GEM9_9ASPA